MSSIFSLNENKNNYPIIVNSNASILVRIISRLKLKFVKLLNALRTPAIIQEFEYSDKLTNQKISIKNQSLHTVITIDGRDYYFNRLNGKFDGTGSGLTCN